MLLGYKRIRKLGPTFSGFSHGFLWSYVGAKSNLHPRTEISSMALLTQNLRTSNHMFKGEILDRFTEFTFEILKSPE